MKLFVIIGLVIVALLCMIAYLIVGAVNMPAVAHVAHTLGWLYLVVFVIILTASLYVVLKL